MTEINFTINWVEIFKIVGYVSLGAAIAIGVFIYVFKDWRPYK